MSREGQVKRYRLFGELPLIGREGPRAFERPKARSRHVSVVEHSFVLINFFEAALIPSRVCTLCYCKSLQPRRQPPTHAPPAESHYLEPSWIPGPIEAFMMLEHYFRRGPRKFDPLRISQPFRGCSFMIETSKGVRAQALSRFLSVKTSCRYHGPCQRL